jgi:hypothetical protein
MNRVPQDPRDIPILTDAVEQSDRAFALVDTTALQSTLLIETLKLADSLLNAAAREIEATLFERVLDRLRAELPELMDRVIREHGDHARSLSE